MVAKDMKVLLLENDAAHAEAIRRALKATRYKVRVAGTLREYRDSVAADVPDIALLNMVISDGRSLDVVSSPPEANPFPILMMASHGDEKTAEKAMQAGALDYVVKSPQAFAVMPRILSRALDRWQLLQERKQAEEAQRLSEQDFHLLAAYHKQLNNISISFIEADDTENLFNRIAESFRVLTGAIASSFSVYNQESRDLKVVSLSINPVSRDKVSSIFGPESFEMRMPVSAEVMQQMLSQIIRRPKDLHELSFGAIPPDISDAVMDAVGCRQIVALAINYAEELIGTCIAYLPEGQPVVPDDSLTTYSYISGLTVKRRRAEEALKTSEAQYRLLSEHTTDSVWLMDMNLKTTYHSPSVEKIRGFTPLEIMELPLEQNLTPQSLKLASAMFLEELPRVETDTDYNPVRILELEYYCKDGTTAWAENKFSIIRDPSGKAVSIMGESRDITTRKQVEQSLRESEAQYHLLSEHTTDTIFLLDMNLNMTYHSPSGEKLRGFTPREIMVMPLEKTLTPESLKLASELFFEEIPKAEADPGYNPIRILDLEYSCKDGSTVWAESKFSIIRDQHGKPVSVLGEGRDISERKRGEELLRQSEQSYRMLADYHKQLNDISISFSEAVDIQDLFNKIAETFRVLTGAVASSFSVYDQEAQELKFVSLSIDQIKRDKVSPVFGSDMLGMRIPVSADDREHMFSQGIRRPKDLHELSSGLIPRDLSDALMDAAGCQQIVALAITYAAELIGTCVAYLPAYMPIVPDEALKTYIYSSGLAVKRKQAEEALRENEEKYRMVVENAMEAIVIEVDGTVKFANRRTMDLTGYSLEEITTRPFIEFVHTDDRRKVAERYIQWLKGDDVPATDVLRFIFKQGDIKWGELSVAPITWEGRPATLGFLTDVTDRKRLEEEQRRVAKLESVGVLAGGIAHDFNNILTSILGNISLARMEAAPGSELQNSLEQAEKASIRAKDLTKQLLTFSKGGAPVKKLASLTELLKDTAGFALRGSNVKCDFFIPSDLWHAEIDAGQVSQVIHNLAINAKQAMPAGGTIELRAENIALSETQKLGKGLPLEAGDYIRIAVVDHGTGIPKDHLEKIFDPFFSTKQKGSGLGLATSFSIARNHGGHLSVKSEVGAGSTFYLYLPASLETVTRERKQDRVAAIKPAGRARILVMDDEQGVREVAGRMLKHLGYQDVEFAADGAEAIKLYKAAMKAGKAFSAAILDLTIPGGMGGKEAIKKLLKIDPGVKAIVSSGYTDDSVMAEYRGYGFSGMAAKPYTLQQLRKALSDVIGTA